MTDDLTPLDIFQRVGDTYANCRSYQDTGCVMSYFGEAADRKRPFSTAFIRPDRFRFEFRNSYNDRDWHRYIISQSGSKIQKWWDIQPGVQEVESLPLAIAAAIGVSGGSSGTVPKMLMPEGKRGAPFVLLKDLKRLSDSEENGADCFRVHGTFAITGPPRRIRLGSDQTESVESKTTGDQILWIDRTSYLLRKIEWIMRSRDSDSKHVTTYEPLIDVDVPEELLAFNPPSDL